MLKTTTTFDKLFIQDTKDVTMTKLNERIKKARTDLHLSQEYVANFLGVNRSAIVEIESGKRKVSAEELGKFGELFQIQTDELLYGKIASSSTKKFIREFDSLDETDQKEIMNLIELSINLHSGANNPFVY